MKRRSTLKLLTLGGLVAASSGGYYWLTKHREHPDLAIDLTLERLNALNVSELENNGSWEVTRTFDHLAQSIEFSMAGFPVMKSPVFQNTVGQLAFSVFQSRGRMSHSLDEEIPGEDINTTNTDPTASLQRLVNSLQQFESFDQPLKPHFAYGALGKDEYALAHVMHINNHLEEFRNLPG